MVCITLLVLGLIMETLSLILIMMPIFAVSIAAMNIDLIWFGIIFTLMIECALITPQLDLNIYVLQAIWNAKMSRNCKRCYSFCYYYVICSFFSLFISSKLRYIYRLNYDIIFITRFKAKSR